MEIYPLIVQIAIAIITIFIAIYAARSSAMSAKSAERSTEQQKGTHDLTALRDFIMREYLEREFKATRTPTIDGKQINRLREAKSQAIAVIRINPTDWDKISTATNRDTWQNQVAFETAWALENLGAAAFMGSLPLRLLLGIVGDVVIDDWLICRSWVKSYRESQRAISQVGSTQSAAIHYHRRHAEWLVLVAVEWMRQHWSYPNCDLVAEWYCGTQNLPAIIQALSQADGNLMPESVRSDLRSLAGMNI